MTKKSKNKGKKFKQPSVSEGNQIRSQKHELDPYLQKPIFSFKYLDRQYSIAQCTKDEKAALIDTLDRLSQLSWRELRQAPRHGLGYEKISRDDINVSIPKFITEDVNFIAFRFCGKAPMVGYRDGEILHLIWLDRDFSLYDHE
ncbi:MAG: hypothetical protein J7647_14500 [Cyanobacteria bacterium SBLK]|nr:hypothetical protein [Cyanobacteria bacterium SBLK]